MKFCIRVDDLGFTAEPIEPAPLKRPDVGLELAQRFHESMGGLPYLGAVIPTCVDEAGRAWLQSKPKGLTVAVHGWRHTFTNAVRSEFHAHSAAEIRHLLWHAQEIIGTTEHLVPPFNAVHSELIEACAMEGIRYVWGEPSEWDTPPQPYPNGGVIMVPSWLPLYAATAWHMSEMDTPLLEVLPRLLDQHGIAVVTLHLPWEAARSATFDGVRRLVELIGDRVVSPAEYLEASR